MYGHSHTNVHMKNMPKLSVNMKSELSFFFLFSEKVLDTPFQCSFAVLILNLFIRSYILRMKEYERERRLMVRRERIAKKKETELLTA